MILDNYCTDKITAICCNYYNHKIDKAVMNRALNKMSKKDLAYYLTDLFDRGAVAVEKIPEANSLLTI